MKESRMKDMLESIAQRNVPGDVNIWPQIAARVERKPFMQTVRARPALVLVLVLLALALLSGVAYAIGKATGYIPGIGFVDQDAPVRMLAEPASQTRDGITMTVKEAFLSTGKTVIVISVENIPVNSLSPDGAGSGCGISAELKLSNGASARILSGIATDDWGSGYMDRFTFTSLPPDISDATLVLPCLAGALPGALPEHWEVPLHFISAPSNMDLIPVVEVTPNGKQNPLTLEKVIETENGYILAGTFRSVRLPQDVRVIQFSQLPIITDASGQNIPFNLANYQLDLPAEKTSAGTFLWAFEMAGKEFAWPLTMTVNSVAAEYPNAQAEFEFDTGAHVQEGQAWDLNLDIDLAGYAVRVLKAVRTADGYSFSFESTSMFHGVNVAVEDSTQGVTGMDDPNHFSSSVRFTSVIPAGKLKVLVTRPVVAISGTWQLHWQPENASAIPMVPPTELPQACIKVDSWQMAFAHPVQIPAELNQRVIVTGPPDEGKEDADENYGTFFVNLDGSDRRVLGQGIRWASPSPDGSQVVFRMDDGLHIAEVATGISHLIPNSLPNDDHPLWSPDGMRIAFVRTEEQKLYAINPDGTQLQSLTDGSQAVSLLDWSPDGSALFYAVETQGGMMLKKLDLASGRSTDLFVANTGSEASISPDGNEIAFFDTIDTSNIGLYVSHPDGSNRKLLAQISPYEQIIQVGLIAPRWSPDGNWLAVSIGNANPNRLGIALINIDTCQIIPLPFSGIVDGWLH